MPLDLHRLAPGLTGSPLDRADRLRHDGAAVAALRDDPAARLLRLDDLAPLVGDDGRLGWGPLAEAPPEAELLFLGLIDGTPRFAALGPVPHAAARPRELFGLLARMPAAEAGTWAAARSLIDWHARHRFCARCGSATRIARAGWQRDCPACGAEHYPRTDPVVIMLAEHDGRVLVGRGPHFPPRHYSALAGFVEVGESMEEAVARELHEEAGVVATRVRYIASQPWPFASSLMLACQADVADPTLTIDRAELDDAMWVGRDEVAAALAGADGATFLAPPPYAIAHTLFRWWLDERV